MREGQRFFSRFRRALYAELHGLMGDRDDFSAVAVAPGPKGRNMMLGARLPVPAADTQMGGGRGGISGQLSLEPGFRQSTY